MTSSKLYILRDNTNKAWCIGYPIGRYWRVNNIKSQTGWFTWIGVGSDSGEVFFEDAHTLKVNNFKEKPDVSN